MAHHNHYSYLVGLSLLGAIVHLERSLLSSSAGLATLPVSQQQEENFSASSLTESVCTTDGLFGQFSIPLVAEVASFIPSKPIYSLSLFVELTTLRLYDMSHMKKEHLYHRIGCEWGCTLQMCFNKTLPHAPKLLPWQPRVARTRVGIKPKTKAAKTTFILTLLDFVPQDIRLGS